jgi:hypothetical protein
MRGEKVVRWVLGGVLCGASVSKGGATTDFVSSIGRLTGAAPEASLVIAWTIILLEGLLGIALFSGRFRGPSLLAASILFAGFAALLMTAWLRRETTPCGCLGPLGPKFSLRAQILFDLTLVMMGVFGWWRNNIQGEPDGGSRRSARVFVILGFIVLFSALVIALPEPRPMPVRSETSLLPDVLGREGEPTHAPAVFFLVDFSDFGCVLCLDDFLALADSVDHLTKRGKVHTEMIVRWHPERSVEAQQRVLRGWMKGNRYGFPARIDQDSLYERTLCKRTSVVVLDARRDVLFSGTFPIGEVRRNEVMDALHRELR